MKSVGPKTLAWPWKVVISRPAITSRSSKYGASSRSASKCDVVLWSVTATKSRPRAAAASSVLNTGHGIRAPFRDRQEPSLWAVCTCRSPRHQRSPCACTTGEKSGGAPARSSQIRARYSARAPLRMFGAPRISVQVPGVSGPARYDGVASVFAKVKLDLFPPLQPRKPSGSRRPRSMTDFCALPVYSNSTVSRSVPGGTLNGIPT